MLHALIRCTRVTGPQSTERRESVENRCFLSHLIFLFFYVSTGRYPCEILISSEHHCHGTHPSFNKLLQFHVFNVEEQKQALILELFLIIHWRKLAWKMQFGQTLKSHLTKWESCCSVQVTAYERSPCYLTRIQTWQVMGNRHTPAGTAHWRKGSGQWYLRY